MTGVMSQSPLKPVVIGIAGGTGSGKNTVARKLVEALPKGQIALIQHDWYYRDCAHLPWEERIQVNFDHPDSLESELLETHIDTLKRGEAVSCPQYDFSTHTRAAEVVDLQPAPIIVVEGILLFAVPALRERFDLRLFVDTADDIRLMRRIKRDIVKRGRDVLSVQDQYYNTVRPMHMEHVAPSKQYAHLVIPEGGKNQIGIDVIVGRLLYGLLDRENA